MHTILIVDDEPAVVEALTAQLMPLSVWIEGTYAAEEAMHLLSQEPAVIIADYLMPGMRGDDFLIEAHKKVPEARLILLTGQAGAENVGKIINHARLFRYVSKPWEVEDIRLTVREALRSYETEKAMKEQEKLSQLLIDYLQALLTCESTAQLSHLKKEWSKKLFGEELSSSEPPPTLSPSQKAAWNIFSPTYNLRLDHLKLLEELEEQVQQRTAHLVQALQELRALSSQREAWIKIVSHDLRGPISGLRQLVALMRNSPLSSEASLKYSEILERTLSELEKYIKNLLDLTRLSQKDIVLQREYFSWKEMVERLHALIAPQLELKKIHWHAEIPPAAIARGDSTYTAEALYNILSNAVKFTPTGGKITLKVLPGDKCDRIEISDTGIGMDSELLAVLWDPTQRRSRLGTAGEKGTGLGLPLAYTILTQQGVSLSVESTPNKGTTFRLEWPHT
ncbi:MAG: hybrid sensor histidine kinase/response regulator [Bacteroidia bacterium]|nr:hybrid sensor histidine kinase/response regulator [Bacteroidia bacterium]MDW8134801.1 hybrid sensor histidine kinase/response regulator [Bacteroidia bacterium]